MNDIESLADVFTGMLNSLGNIEHLGNTVVYCLAAIGVFILAKMTARRLLDV